MSAEPEQSTLPKEPNWPEWWHGDGRVHLWQTATGQIMKITAVRDGEHVEIPLPLGGFRYEYTGEMRKPDIWLKIVGGGIEVHEYRREDHR